MELREKIADVIRYVLDKDKELIYRGDNLVVLAADQILALIKEEGYTSRELTKLYCDSAHDLGFKEGVEKTLAIAVASPEDILNQYIKRAGYVKLAKDQTFPESPFQEEGGAINQGYVCARQDLRQVGWRKVELEGTPK